MLIKTLIFNSDRSMDQILRDVLIDNPLTVNRSSQLLQDLIVSVGILIIDIGGFFHVIVIQVDLRQGNNIILQILSQHSDKNKSANDADQKNGRHRTGHHLHCGKEDPPDSTDNSKQNIGVPILARRPSSAKFFLCHNRLPP